MRADRLLEERTEFGEEEHAIHLTDYYHVVTRYKWSIIVCLLVVVSFVLWYNSRLTPIYRATTSLIIDRETMRSPLTGQAMDLQSYLSESMTFNTHFKLITSRHVLEQVIRDLELDQTPGKQQQQGLAEINPLRRHLSKLKKNIGLLLGRKAEKGHPQDRMTGLVRSLRGMVRTIPVEETRLLNIEVLNPDPVMARDIANALARAYIDFNIDSRVKSYRDTLSWLTDHLYAMKKKLEDAEAEFLEFRRKVRLLSPEESQRMITQKMTDFNNAYIQARNRRLEINAKLEQLRGVSLSGGDVSHLRSLIENPLIKNLYGQLLSAEVELSRVSKVFKSKHPKVIELESRIENTRNRMQEEIKKEISNLQAEREVLLAKEEVLQKTIADFEKEAMETDRKELSYTILKRNVEMNQNLYDTILSRLKEADVMGNIDVSNIRVTEAAVLPRFPVSPNKKKNLIVGIIVGLMLGIGLSFFRNYLDRSLRTEEDVQRHLGLPVLSVIPVADQALVKLGSSSRSRKAEK